MAGMTPEELLGTTGWSALSGQASMPLPVVTTPSSSWWESLTGAFAAPFRATAQGIAGSATTIVGAVGQGIHDILIAKYLSPKVQPQSSGSVIYLEKPQAGNAPPTINIAVPPTGTTLASMLPQNVSQMSPWLIVAPLALIAFLLLRKK